MESSSIILQTCLDDQLPINASRTDPLFVISRLTLQNAWYVHPYHLRRPYWTDGIDFSNELLLSSKFNLMPGMIDTLWFPALLRSFL